MLISYLGASLRELYCVRHLISCLCVNYATEKLIARLNTFCVVQYGLMFLSCQLSGSDKLTISCLRAILYGRKSIHLSVHPCLDNVLEQFFEPGLGM